MEICVRRLDDGHVCLRRAHAGTPLAWQSVADRAPSYQRRMAPVFQRGLFDLSLGARSPVSAAAWRLSGAAASSVARGGNQDHVVVRPPGRSDPLLGRDRASCTVPVAEGREDSRARGFRAEGESIRTCPATRNRATGFAEDAVAATFSV